MDKLVKKGMLDKSKNGQMTLINNKGEFYKINQSIAYMWNLFDGKNTVKDIMRDLNEVSPMNSKELEIGINSVISQLKKCELVE